MVYNKIDRLVELLLKEDLDDLDERMGKRFPVDRYLLKIIALFKDVNILFNAANSPRLLPLFKSELRIHSLAPSEPLKFSLPNSPP